MGKATGPRTTKGKARASQNAAKHWIESGRILPEEQREAQILRNGFAEDFKPSGLMEWELIEDLVFNRLIKRRIDVAFTREFSKATVEKAIDFLENREHSATRYYLRRPTAPYYLCGAGREQDERLRPELCLAALEALKVRIDAHGPQPEDLLALQKIYGSQPTEQAAFMMCDISAVAEERDEQDETAEAARQAELKKSILEALVTEIERQKQRDELAKHRDAIEFASDIQEPTPPVLDALLRYRAANTREFKDLLGTLELIRRLRKSAA